MDVAQRYTSKCRDNIETAQLFLAMGQRRGCDCHGEHVAGGNISKMQLDISQKTTTLFVVRNIKKSMERAVNHFIFSACCLPQDSQRMLLKLKKLQYGLACQGCCEMLL
jgi:hypothetical protein